MSGGEWSAKVKVTKSSSSTGGVGFEYNLEYTGEDLDFEEYERKLFKLRQLSVLESNKIETMEVLK